MKSLLKTFKSVKLAVSLISYIIVTSILATLIPQGKELAFYYSNYPSVISCLILNTQLNNFFYSFLFIVPLLLFFINLTVCMLNRLIRELKKKRKKRLGPDLIHLGLLVLIISGIITYAGRQEGFTYLAGLRIQPLYDITIISEYYHNDTGLTKDEYKDYLTYLDNIQSCSCQALRYIAQGLPP